MRYGPDAPDPRAVRLAGDDPAPLRYQVIEFPAVRPVVTEFRRHRLPCPSCGRVVCPPLPTDVRGGYGPRVHAVCALLSGAYHVGNRGAARLMEDLFGVPIGSAAVCDLPRETAAALEPVVRAAHAHVAGMPANVDETGWREARKRGWLWVAVTANITVFLIRLFRGRKVLTTDRYPAYGHLPTGHCQVCWPPASLPCHAAVSRSEAGDRSGGTGEAGLQT